MRRRPLLVVLLRPLLGAALFALLLVPSAAQADQQGTLLTVTGTIGKPNRPPFSPFADGIFAHYGVSFDKAHAFSFRDLADLGMHRLRLRYPDWPAALTFRGPRLRDVLAAAGAAGRSVTFQGLDGYESRFDVADLPGDKTILALEVDGKPLSIGGRGPLWLVFPAGTVAHQDPASDAGLAWALFHIKVE